MNERIERLAFKVMDEPVDLERTHLKIDVVKFAELIVRECAEFARQHNLEKADRSHMIHKAINQHFGVEE